ncbi:hypothetical protein F5X99DRAFT_412089 [Biscogniauxia marginata]|nr:hypothetical protein F5X99DRAFT_412089 [Biscogniauxia marginata]
MRGDALLGVLWALGLVGSVSAQGYVRPSGPSGSGAGNKTCPVPKPTTVFVTVTPAFLPTVFSTVFSTVVSTVAPAPGQGGPNQGGSIFNPSSTGPIVWSPPRTISIPCSSSSTDAIPWSTDFLTLTLPPASGQNASSVLTYTIVSPPNPNPVGFTQAPPNSALGTLTITLEPSIQGGGYGGNSNSQELSSATPRVITITGTTPDGPGGWGSASITTLTASPVPPGPFGISSLPIGDTSIESASEGSEGGGSQLPTITITATGESPSGGGQGSGQGGPAGQSTPATIIIVPPHQSISGPGSQGTSPTVITIYPPESSEGPVGSGGQETSPSLESELGSSGNPPASSTPEVLTIFGNPPTGDESSSILTIITTTSAPESPSGESGGPNGGSNGGSPELATITLTIPGSSLEGPSSEDNSGTFTPTQLTSFVPSGPSEGLGGSGNGGSPGLPTITLTVPGGSSEGPGSGGDRGNLTSPANTVATPGGPTGTGGIRESFTSPTPEGPSGGLGTRSISPTPSNGGTIITNPGGYGGSLSVLPPIIGSTAGSAGPGGSDGQGSPGVVTITGPPQSGQSVQSSPGIITISGPPSDDQSVPGTMTIASSFPSGVYGAPPPSPTVSASNVSPGASASSAISGSGAITGTNAFTDSNAVFGTGTITDTSPNSKISPSIGSAPPWINITRVTTISDAPTRTKTIKSWTPIGGIPRPHHYP